MSANHCWRRRSDFTALGGRAFSVTTRGDDDRARRRSVGRSVYEGQRLESNAGRGTAGGSGRSRRQWTMPARRDPACGRCDAVFPEQYRGATRGVVLVRRTATPLASRRFGHQSPFTASFVTSPSRAAVSRIIIVISGHGSDSSRLTTLPRHSASTDGNFSYHSATSFICCLREPSQRRSLES